MRRALDLAARGLGRTSPNPAVGAVVVTGGRVVGEGCHQRAGEPHAEPLALAQAGAAARGATLYVTLEPCCHQGRTPPCTDAILAAGIARVVYACGDIDPRCRGRGEATLREAGVEVTRGVLEDEARRLNEAYIRHKLTGRPFVTLKLACTLDGHTATCTGDSRWISGEASRERVHRLRDRSDAIMVGVGTVLTDDPQLTARLPEGEGRHPLRVVVDALARTPADARVITGPGSCLVAVTEAAPPADVARLREAGAEVADLPAAEGSGQPAVDLPALMDHLGARAVMSVLLEGGAALAGAMVRAGLVGKHIYFIAPRLLGGTGAPVLAGPGVATMAEAQPLEFTSVEHLGRVGRGGGDVMGDVMIEAYPCSQD
jgi:diaminohydroxyphosphoribosylaminopyrimidine deaminase/5-amino-6-(5-phosphoribosylamino)uracil reductase